MAAYKANECQEQQSQTISWDGHFSLVAYQVHAAFQGQYSTILVVQQQYMIFFFFFLVAGGGGGGGCFQRYKSAMIFKAEVFAILSTHLCHQRYLVSEYNP